MHHKDLSLTRGNLLPEKGKIRKGAFVCTNETGGIQKGPGNVKNSSGMHITTFKRPKTSSLYALPLILSEKRTISVEVFLMWERTLHF